MHMMDEFFPLWGKTKLAFGFTVMMLASVSSDPEETLASIITVKLAMESESIKTLNLPGEVLPAAKSVTCK